MHHLATEMSRYHAQGNRNAALREIDILARHAETIGKDKEPERPECLEGGPCEPAKKPTGFCNGCGG
jgi:hypothetical protein